MDGEKKRSWAEDIARGLLCSAGAFLMDFILIPEMAVGVPEVLWMPFMLLLPAVLAAAAYRGMGSERPWVLLIGLPLQYLVLYLFAGPLARHMEMTLHGLGGFAYRGFAAAWPLLAVLAQMIAVEAVGKMYRRIYPRQR